jgi:hypothetical protein
VNPLQSFRRRSLHRVPERFSQTPPRLSHRLVVARRLTRLSSFAYRASFFFSAGTGTPSVNRSASGTKVGFERSMSGGTLAFSVLRPFPGSTQAPQAVPIGASRASSAKANFEISGTICLDQGESIVPNSVRSTTVAKVRAIWDYQAARLNGGGYSALPDKECARTVPTDTRNIVKHEGPPHRRPLVNSNDIISINDIGQTS